MNELSNCTNKSECGVPNINVVINGGDRLGQQLQCLCLLRQSIGAREAGGIEAANYNQCNSYHHLQGLLMASPRAGRESNTHLHLGDQHFSVYAARLLSIISV
mgnify:CR=1 FL=1